jgi:hypothetical protein
MFQWFARGAVFAGALLSGGPAAADDSTVAGDVTIYHSAFTADTLTPEIARVVGVQRSQHLGVLNVSVRRGQAGSTPVPVKAWVDVDLSAGERRLGAVVMREVEAEGGVSYLGQFPIKDGEELTFEIRVRPVGAAVPTTVWMRQEFFTD